MIYKIVAANRAQRRRSMTCIPFVDANTCVGLVFHELLKVVQYVCIYCGVQVPMTCNDMITLQNMGGVVEGS